MSLDVSALHRQYARSLSCKSFTRPCKYMYIQKVIDPLAEHTASKESTPDETSYDQRSLMAINSYYGTVSTNHTQQFELNHQYAI